ncbi:MAG: hypothetical protein JW896_01500 [Deltaproteobacteria bacterium]|nr:hypothetical protein [Deltaproteobacteria bacterium]
MSREGDIVLIYHQDQPALYARIEAIQPDVKKDWYRLNLLLLTIPAQAVTWILCEEYINGASFTMNGQPIRLERVKRLDQSLDGPDEGSLSSGQRGKDAGAKVIPIKKKDAGQQKLTS